MNWDKTSYTWMSLAYKWCIQVVNCEVLSRKIREISFGNGRTGNRRSRWHLVNLLLFGLQGHDFLGIVWNKIKSSEHHWSKMKVDHWIIDSSKSSPIICWLHLQQTLALLCLLHVRDCSQQIQNVVPLDGILKSLGTSYAFAFCNLLHWTTTK